MEREVRNGAPELMVGSLELHEVGEPQILVGGQQAHLLLHKQFLSAFFVCGNHLCNCGGEQAHWLAWGYGTA